MRNQLLNYIYERNPAQEKKITLFLKQPLVLDELDEFLTSYAGYMSASGITIYDLADSYLGMVAEMCTARLEFTRTGKYPMPTQDEAKKGVYDNQKVMTSFMLGLGLSQFLWSQHSSLFMFYKASISNLKDAGRFLEVGSGHGLFLKELLTKIRKSDVDVIDISAASIKLSKEIILALEPSAISRLHFLQQDILTFITAHKYSFITIGEVLEHVEHPLDILLSLRNILTENGRIYVSTCANCPTLDHVFHFETLDQIRDMIHTAGFEIESEVVAPAECCSMERLIKKKIDIVFGAILMRKLQ